MKKFLALLLAAMMILCLVACGSEEVTEPETEDPTTAAGVANSDDAEISDEQLKALTEAYNQVAPIFNEVYAAAEENGWVTDEPTATEINAVNATLGTIGKALTEDLTMLNGCEDFDALINGVLAFGPALEELAERVSVPYGDVG